MATARSRQHWEGLAGSFLEAWEGITGCAILILASRPPCWWRFVTAALERNPGGKAVFQGHVSESES